MGESARSHRQSRREGGLTRILITGGAGFLGSHLAERLLKDGHRVHVVDNLSTGSTANTMRLRTYPRFSWTLADISLPWSGQMSEPYERKWSQIYNLACPASPKAYSADPVQTILTCTLGMKAVLDLATLSGAKVLQASTSEVYGDPLLHPQKETHWGHVNTVGPRACYDEGKRVAETLCYEYGKQGVQVRIARLFNTYGPRMQVDDGRVVSNFVVQGLKGEDLTVYGTGAQTRSLCYVDDTVEGLIRLMNSPVSDPVNIGNPVETTMLQLAQMIRNLTGNKSRLVKRPLPVDDPKKRCPDISRAKLCLDWEPRENLGGGLTKTINYFREVLGETAARPGTERPVADAADSAAQ